MPDIDHAIQILRAGGLVAFPTETVYGLGADATNAAAVRRIFEVKGRPSTNPLICHVADESVARRYALDWPLAVSQLVARFWPGPLTVVLPKSSEIVDEVTAGLPTVGLRAPNHPLTLELLRQFDKPLAGPSANRSSHVSPTTAQHVRDDLGDSIDMILDGGPCTVGIESTVIDFTTPRPLIRRPGGVSREQIEQVIGLVDVLSATISADVASVSPGQHARHYAPRTPAYRFESSEREKIGGMIAGAPAGFISLSDTTGHHVTAMPDDPELYARSFYAVLREMDAMALSALFIEMPPDKPQWLAVRDRILRATQPLPDGPK